MKEKIILEIPNDHAVLKAVAYNLLCRLGYAHNFNSTESALKTAKKLLNEAF